MANKRLFNLLKRALYQLGLITDFVVDFGADGDWVWRKWNSGIGECWLSYKGAIDAYTSSGPGTGLRYGRYTTFDYPFEFIESPSVTALAAQNTGFAYTFSTVSASGDLDKFTVYWASNNDVDDCRLFIHVLGLWKTIKWGGYYLLKLLRRWVYETVHLAKRYYFDGKIRPLKEAEQDMGKARHDYEHVKIFCNVLHGIKRICKIWWRASESDSSHFNVKLVGTNYCSGVLWKLYLCAAYKNDREDKPTAVRVHRRIDHIRSLTDWGCAA